jgi:hypothetical protein
VFLSFVHWNNISLSSAMYRERRQKHKTRTSDSNWGDEKDIHETLNMTLSVGSQC